MSKKSSNIFLLFLLLGLGVYVIYMKGQWENRILKQIIQRLEADSRAAEAVVTNTAADESGRVMTTIRFVEYDPDGRPLEPKFFTFHGNLIQFQSLVIRFDDLKIRSGDALKGKSAYLFWKAFRLAGPDTEEYEINLVDEVPPGYRVAGEKNLFEKALWKKFWDYAMDQEKAQANHVKNAQIEAPGTKFLPGYLYSFRIEHDGGLRIDVSRIPDVFQK